MSYVLSREIGTDCKHRSIALINFQWSFIYLCQCSRRVYTTHLFAYHIVGYVSTSELQLKIRYALVYFASCYYQAVQRCATQWIISTWNEKRETMNEQCAVYTHSFSAAPKILPFIYIHEAQSNLLWNRIRNCQDRMSLLAIMNRWQVRFDQNAEWCRSICTLSIGNCDFVKNEIASYRVKLDAQENLCGCVDWRST